MSSLSTTAPSAIKNALSLITVHDLSSGTVLCTTLYYSTGNARPHNNLGFDNITNLKGSKVDFGSAAPGATLDSSYVKSVESAYSESTIAFHNNGQPV